MHLHLFSMPGPYPMQYLVSASEPYLAGRDHPVVLYAPAAGKVISPRYVAITRTAFQDLAEVEVLDLTAPISAAALESAFDRATVLLIPGGNTYLLLHRLRVSGGFDLIEERVRAGLPLVGFSAGMIICGPDILTSNDENGCGLTDFNGLRFTRYSFSAHYPSADTERVVERDRAIRDYHSHTRNPVLALEDDGYVEIDSHGAHVRHGHCWLFEPGEPKILLDPGPID